MQGSDASQFTRLKKASAVQKGPSRSDLKSTNRLTQYVTELSAISDEKKFLPSLSLKNTVPVARVPINRDFPGKKNSSLQNCA